MPIHNRATRPPRLLNAEQIAEMEAVRLNKIGGNIPYDLQTDYHEQIAAAAWAERNAFAIFAAVLCVLAAAALLLSAMAVSAASVPASVSWFEPQTEMVRTGNCGSGGAVTGDPCTPVVATDQSEKVAFGQQSPGMGTWWNTNDTGGFQILGASDRAMRGIRVTIKDGCDQRGCFFKLALGDQTWETTERGANGNFRTIFFPFADPTRRFTLSGSTMENDGASVQVMACSVKRGKGK